MFQGVTELVFHHNQPAHMFSASENGEVWHWNGSAASRLNFQSSASGDGASSNLWFNNRFELVTLQCPRVCRFQHLEAGKDQRTRVAVERLNPPT